MKDFLLTNYLCYLITIVCFSNIIVGCYTVTQPIDPLQLAEKTTANARMASVSGICDYDYTNSIESELMAAGWKKTFEDNFDVSPNSGFSDKWNVWVGGAFNNELQMFTASPNNLFVTLDPVNPANSILQIKAIKEAITGPKYRQDINATPTNFDFTSARIESKTMFAPNRTNTQVRMISRIKLPTGYGMWPAFWSYGDNWPTNGEIDVLEARGNEPYQFQTNYFYGRKADQNLVQNEATYLTTATSLTDCWHVYEVIWTKNDLTFLLDGEVVDVKSGSYVPNLFGKLERLTLNQAVGGNFFYKDGTTPTADQIPINEGEGVMLIDWVKVFVKK